MIYFDHAATTPLDPEVIRVMEQVLRENYGNPSSVHAAGRASRVIIEESRRQIASLLGVRPWTLTFTSCGTEAINTVLDGAVESLGITRVITSPIEHHAVSHTLDKLIEAKQIQVDHVNLLPGGHVDLVHLERLLTGSSQTLVCLMHANNELGLLLDLETTAALCKQHGALFLCDCVQSIGKLPLDLGKIKLDFTACSAHKFHGPKGVGFLYVREGLNLPALIHGGGQERNLRSGTENIAGIAGMARALELACHEMEQKIGHIRQLRDAMAEGLRQRIPEAVINSETNERGLPNLLHVTFPSPPYNDMLLQRLDMEGICVSGGSACSSGAVSVSPVLKAAGCGQGGPSVRFSFSRFNTPEEVKRCLDVLCSLQG